MPSYYDSLKVQNLIRTYRANPMMFSDDQLDELERLAADNQIEFKRIESNFSLRRGLQQAQAGFIEGLTTFDLIPKEPRNTGEAIFRQLGHLSGFAPAIMKAPVIGMAKLGAKITGNKTYGRFTQAALDGIDALDAISVPMIASRKTKSLFEKGLTKTGAESFDFLKRGARTRAITEEALGLASATAVSSIWKGKDAVVDAYIGGAIAGGAFGGIGNFVSVGNLYKGTPAQVEQANKLLRAGVASAFLGVPATLRGEPTEMQIYEYLLGGFFGYNTRPARETEAAKWINRNRNPEEIFRPEKSDDWTKVSKDAQQFILYDHPMTQPLNSEGLGGSSGAALKYLEKWAERTGKPPKFREAAVRHFEKNKIKYTEQDIQDYYRTKAAEIYKINSAVLENALVYNNAILNDERIDQMDSAEKELFNINDMSKRISKTSEALGTSRDVGSRIDTMAQESVRDGEPNVEIFMDRIESEFGRDIARKENAQLRGWYRSRMQKPQEQDLVTITVGGKTSTYRKITKEKIGDVTVGEKFDKMPATYLVPEAEFQLMTHVVKEVLGERGGVEQQAIKIMEQNLVKGEIVYSLGKNDLSMLQNTLSDNDRYIVHGIKDKDHVLTSRFRDEGLTLDNVFDILSNIETRDNIETSYKRSLALEKQIYGDTPEVEALHERKWISNVVNMAEMNNLKIEDAWAIIDPDQNFGKSVADLNKRMSLFTNHMTPMVSESFRGVDGMNGGKDFNVIIVDDVGLPSDTDGMIQFRTDMLDASSRTMGRNPKITGHMKPVIAAKNELGFLATKSNGQEAFPALNEWMEANNIHAVIYKSSAKLTGNNPVSRLTYKDGKYSSDNLNPIKLPIETLQISSGTYENTAKDTKGTSLPMQFYGQSNEVQAKGYSDVYIDKLLRPSLKGSINAQEIVAEFKKNDDIKAFAEAYKDKKLKLEELPFDFITDVLLNKPDSEIGKLLSDRLMKLEIDGELDTPVYESFEFDSDVAFQQFHEVNRYLAEASRGTFVAKHSMIFNKKNYFNALRKYMLKRIANPHIETAGKSWLKGFTPDMMSYVDIDPAKKTRTLKQGEIYLDNGFRKMPVVLFGERYTLGEVWDMYTGKATMPKGVKKPTAKEWNDVFNFLVIRTPSDSMSGTRKLRFRGFTGQKGAGSFTHDKDNAYLGGADKDADSIKIFQGIDKELIKHYVKNANERKHWNKKYTALLDKEFQASTPQITVDDFKNNKIMMFSPSFRFQVARNANTGKAGLGYGLSAKIAMQNMYDYIAANGGKVTINGVDIRLKKKSPHEGVSAHRYFLDLGTKIVNVSADASNDPNLRSYNEYRDMLFNSIFEVSKSGKPITKYSSFTEALKGTAIEAIKDSINNIKPHQKLYNEKGESRSPTIFEVLDNVERVNRVISGVNGVETVNPRLNELLEEIGFRSVNYKFRNLQDVHQRLYNDVMSAMGFYKNAGGKFQLRNNKVAKQLEDFYGIIAEELSFATPKRIQTLLMTDPDQALDLIGKELGQYATMELLTDQFIKMQNSFADQGRSVNVVKELLPKIKKRAYEVKNLADKLADKRDRDNVTNTDLDALIHKTMTGLAEMERTNGLEDGMLQDYFSYWLLSPLRSLRKYGKYPNQPQYNKTIHGSTMIPMYAKRNFYKRMDTIYDRVKADEGRLEIKQADIQTVLKESPIQDNRDVQLTINEALKSKKLEGLALFDADLKEVQRFQRSLQDHPVVSKDFNEWYQGFTMNLGSPKDATTMTMKDIRIVNRYLDSLNSSKDMELKLAQFYQHPLTVDEIMIAKGLFGGYHKIINAPIQTSKGIVYRDVKIMMSPVGNIANYFRKAEAGMSKYTNRKHLDTVKMDEIIDTLSESDKLIYMKDLIAVREGDKSIADISPKINKKKFNKLNEEFTKFWNRMSDNWINTKDSNGKVFDWNSIDKDNKYGQINEYLRYNKNGKFDFKLFEDKILNARDQSQEMISRVGIEGVLRYRFEYEIEKSLRIAQKDNPKIKINKKEYRESKRLEKPFRQLKLRDPKTYIHHSFRNPNEGLLVEQAEWLAGQPKEKRNELARKMQQDNEFINTNDIIDIDPNTEMAISFSEESMGREYIPDPLKPREGDAPFKKSYDLVSDYQNKLIQGYYRNLMKFKAQNEIDAMMKNMKDYKPSKHEQKIFNDLYKGIPDASIESGGIPKKFRYRNYLDVWADYVRLYARDSLGYQTFFNERMSTPQGRKLLHLNKKNLYYGTSDEAIIKKMESLYKNKLGKKENIPFFNNKAIPKEARARKEYFSRLVHELGRMEAQYELMSLLANTGTWTTNIFGGNTMIMGSAGVKNYVNSFRNKRVYDALLTDRNGKVVLKLLDGTDVTNRKQLLTYLEERGVIDNFIKHEFEYNESMTSGLKKVGINIKDFKRDITKAIKTKKGDRDESVLQVAERYGVKDLMLKTGGFLMKQSERVNRLNAFIAHGLQAVESFGAAGRNLSLADQYVFDRAERGIEVTQFLYQNSFRPAFMRTSMGKVLGRFKLFVFNSVRMRKEFYKQAKLQGFKQGTESYERYKDIFAIDMMMYALGSAFMFSLFDTTLPPPWDWVQALADWTFGDKKEREMAFFGSKLGPLNVLKPPIARVPEAFGELLTGQTEDFTNYTMYTLFPFGRGVRQIKQLADPRPRHGLERAPEILFRIPYNQMKSRIECGKRRQGQTEQIETMLGQPY